MTVEAVCPTLNIRLAQREDALHLASLYLEATDPQGNLWLAHQRQAHETLLETGARLFSRNDHPQSYLNCYLAESTGRIIGLIQGDSAQSSYSPFLLPQYPWPNDCFVIGLWVVDPSWRSQGVGQTLLKFAFEIAQKKGYHQCGLLAPLSLQNYLSAFGGQLIQRPLSHSPQLIDWALSPFCFVLPGS